MTVETVERVDQKVDRKPPTKWRKLFRHRDKWLFKGYVGKPEQVTKIQEELSRRWGNAKPWTERDLRWLSENYGLLPDREICKHLGRTFSSILLASKRLIHINRKMNFYTASEVAREMGVPCSKVITGPWMLHNYIRGKRSHVHCGSTRTWLFTYEDIEKALMKRPWIAHLESMPVNYFRHLVESEYERDPWYSVTEAALLLGVKDGYRAALYIRKGWLKGEFSHTGANNRHWVVRRSAIQKFLDKDPRPEHRRIQLILSKREKRIKRGKPAKVAVTWLVPCPQCHELVEVIADPRLFAPEVMRRFRSQFNIEQNGACSHDGKASLEDLVPISCKSDCLG